MLLKKNYRAGKGWMRNKSTKNQLIIESRVVEPLPRTPKVKEGCLQNLMKWICHFCPGVDLL